MNVPESGYKECDVRPLLQDKVEGKLSSHLRRLCDVKALRYPMGRQMRMYSISLELKENVN